MRTFGTYIVELLAANGVECVFGIPGVHTVELYRGLEDSRIRHLTPRHEQGAGFMADGYARVSGKPGVCFTISGPGLTNIVTAMGQAYGDSIPMLVISAVNSPGNMGSGAGHLHELPDQRQLMRQVSAFSHTVLKMDEFEHALARAFAIFSSARPRPVHIEIPVSMLSQDSEDLGNARTFSLPLAAAATVAAADAAAKIMNEARRPLIVAGGGAVRASEQIKALAERWDAPVLMTVNGRGIIPPDHPLAVPIFPGSTPALDLLHDADAILAVGTELGPTDFEDAFACRTTVWGQVIRVDIDPEQAMRGLFGDVVIVADASQAAAQLGRLVAPGNHQGPERSDRARAAVANTANNMQRAGLALFDMIFDTPDTIVVGDSTQPIYAASLAFGTPRARSFFCSATGYGTLGYALPAAIGAKLDDPRRPVVCVIGDGGLQFTMPEMATAAEVGLPITMIVWNNSGYGEIKSYMQAAGIAPMGVDILTPDFQKIASAVGWHAEKLADAGDLVERLDAARRRSMPTMIEIDEASFVSAIATLGGVS